MGPWLTRASHWIGMDVPVQPAEVTSVVVRPSSDSAATALLRGSVPAALFVDYAADDASVAASVEVYPRPDGTVYSCGAGDDSLELPDDPATIVARPQATDLLLHTLTAVMPTCLGLPRSASEAGASASSSSSSEVAGVVARQACFLPLSADGLPLIGASPHHDHLWIAGGHGCWGILTGPGTGRHLSDLILGDESTPRLLSAEAARAFDPSRFVQPSTTE